MWLKASYHFHTYCYRDPRSAFASGVGIPVVSPTTVFLGLVSTLFRSGRNEEAYNFIKRLESFQLLIDAPDSIIFFRAFHQIRRYETTKKGKNPVTKKWDVPNPRIGLTNINQATKEYGLVEGKYTLYLYLDESLTDNAIFALTNLTHLGTYDSLCSLIGTVEKLDSLPTEIIYHPSTEVTDKQRSDWLQPGKSITMVTLSRFKNRSELSPTVGSYWYMAGGKDTELVTYVIPGKFVGAVKGKIYKKNQ